MWTITGFLEQILVGPEEAGQGGGRDHADDVVGRAENGDQHHANIKKR